MRRWLGSVLVAAILVGLGAAEPATALEPGVFVDPNSPAGREYSFPLSVLRSQAAGHPSAPDGVSQPMFGVGVTRASGAGVSGAADRASASGRSRGGKRPAALRRATGVARGFSDTSGKGNGAGTPPISQAALIRLARPGSAAPVIALVSALVVAVGLGLGTAFGKLRRSS